MTHACLLALAVAMLPAPAAARDEPRQPAAQRSISQAQAIRIARGYGMTRIEEIERDDGGWEIEGRDHRGRSLDITINRQGRVTGVDRGDSPEDDDD